MPQHRPRSSLSPSPPYRAANRSRADWYTNSVSSLHPGGCNFAFADGSVRFLKESISSWPVDRVSGIALGVTDGYGTFDGTTLYNITPGTKLGVYQKLSTRSGGEPLSADEY